MSSVKPDWLDGLILSVLKKRFRREPIDSQIRRIRKLQWEYMLCLLKPKCGPAARMLDLSPEDMREARDFLRFLFKAAIVVHKELENRQGMRESDFERIMNFCEDFYDMTQVLITSYRRIPEGTEEEDRIFKAVTGFLSRYYWI